MKLGDLQEVIKHFKQIYYDRKIKHYDHNKSKIDNDFLMSFLQAIDVMIDEKMETRFYELGETIDLNQRRMYSLLKSKWKQKIKYYWCEEEREVFKASEPPICETCNNEMVEVDKKTALKTKLESKFFFKFSDNEIRFDKTEFAWEIIEFVFEELGEK
jgi:hypothetical protein